MKNQLAVFLKSKRVAAGLSQRQVADRLAYTTPQFISNWERGVSHPPIPSLKKLGALYSIPAEELFDVLLKASIVEIKAELTRKFNSSRAA